MGILKPLRELFIKSTNLTRHMQGKSGKLAGFYKLWSYCYDVSVNLDPAFRQQMKKMISMTVKPGDTTLDIGCGTGISTLYASETARKIVGIDPSTDMLRKLENKIGERKITNIEVVAGGFPEASPQGVRFDSIISSFAIVHFTPELRKAVYKRIFEILQEGGRLGLFAARGEIAASFETREEIENNLISAGFGDIEIIDVSDIYRIVYARKKAK